MVAIYVDLRVFMAPCAVSGSQSWAMSGTLPQSGVPVAGSVAGNCGKELRAMRQEAWRAYLEMALGVTEASGKKAMKTVKQLVGKRVTASQLQALAEELAKASAANRDAVRNVVKIELERALGAVGLAKADEVAALTARVHELEAQLGAASTVDGGAPAAPAKKAVAKKAVAKKAVAKKAVAKTAVAVKPAQAVTPANAVTPAAESAAATDLASPPAAVAALAATTAPAKREPAKRAPATTAPAKKAPAKQAAAKQAAAKKAAPAKRAGDGPASASDATAPAKRPAKKVTKRAPGSGEPVP
jgi:polyhydroxyalkanoate synthesis regulator phasin